MPSLTSSENVVISENLYQYRPEFIENFAPIAVSVLYFGGLRTSPQDAALYRQALYKLSFLYRHFLQPAGLRISVRRQVAILSGAVRLPAIVTMGKILAQQIEGLAVVQDEVALPGIKSRHRATEDEGTEELLSATRQDAPARHLLMDEESLQALVLTRWHLRLGDASSQLQAQSKRGVLHLSGTVSSVHLKEEAESLAAGTLGVRDVRSQITLA